MTMDPDEATRAELAALIDAARAGEAGAVALAERFAGGLQFGTAGIRGILGAGPMRMNRLVVRKISAGLAAYVKTHVANAGERGVVVGFDARRNSRVFADEVAQVFLARGFRVYLGESELPTPATAFATERLGAAAGIMVTASHNPPEYNGYKVYWENGAQIIPPHESGIFAEIENVADLEGVELADLDQARSSGRLAPIGRDVIDGYFAGLHELLVHRDAVSAAPITIAYTPLHGVGADFVERALDDAGFDSVHTVASQREPDGTFPTVAFPNPEEDGAMDEVLELAGKVEADLVLANDPDVDRLAVALPAEGGYRMLSGDQIGILLADYLLEATEGEKRLVATTVVSSQLLREMARSLGVEFKATLTGFKWIANAGIDYKSEGGRFVLGYEEALGYCCGELVHDKDGVSAVLLFAELTAYEKSRGRTVWDRLADIYGRHGLYLTEQRSLTLPGADGLERIRSLMARFRAHPPTEIGGYKVVEHQDLAATGLSGSNVLLFFLEGGRRVIMRPSGTEPKLKSYYEVREPVEASVDSALKQARLSLAALADAHQATLE